MFFFWGGGGGGIFLFFGEFSFFFGGRPNQYFSPSFFSFFSGRRPENQAGRVARLEPRNPPAFFRSLLQGAPREDWNSGYGLLGVPPWSLILSKKYRDFEASSLEILVFRGTFHPIWPNFDPVLTNSDLVWPILPGRPDLFPPIPTYSPGGPDLFSPISTYFVSQ